MLFLLSHPLITFWPSPLSPSDTLSNTLLQSAAPGQRNLPLAICRALNRRILVARARSAHPRASVQFPTAPSTISGPGGSRPSSRFLLGTSRSFSAPPLFSSQIPISSTCHAAPTASPPLQLPVLSCTRQSPSPNAALNHHASHAARSARKTTQQRHKAAPNFALPRTPCNPCLTPWNRRPATPTRQRFRPCTQSASSVTAEPIPVALNVCCIPAAPCFRRC